MNKQIRKKNKYSERGYTLLEVLVAISILILGSTFLWESYRAGALFSVSNEDRRFALQIIQNEMEKIRTMPKEELEDDHFEVSMGPHHVYELIQTVVDHDERQEQKESYLVSEAVYPSEVRLEIFRKQRAEGAEFSDTEEKPILSMSLILPEYQWY